MDKAGDAAVGCRRGDLRFRQNCPLCARLFGEGPTGVTFSSDMQGASARVFDAAPASERHLWGTASSQPTAGRARNPRRSGAPRDAPTPTLLS